MFESNAIFESNWLRTQRGSAVRTPRAAEPEGEREVWRERVEVWFSNAWRKPRAPSPEPEPRAPSPEPRAPMYTVGAFGVVSVV